LLGTSHGSSGQTETYLALQNAETTLKDVHDGIVDALVVVDGFVAVHTCNNIDRTVLLVPSFLLGFLLFSLYDLLEEFDVASGEEVETTVNVDDLLIRLWRGSVDLL